MSTACDGSQCLRWWPHPGGTPEARALASEDGSIRCTPGGLAGPAVSRYRTAAAAGPLRGGEPPGLQRPSGGSSRPIAARLQRKHSGPESEGGGGDPRHPGRRVRHLSGVRRPAGSRVGLADGNVGHDRRGCSLHGAGSRATGAAAFSSQRAGGPVQRSGCGHPCAVPGLRRPRRSPAHHQSHLRLLHPLRPHAGHGDRGDPLPPARFRLSV